ncbi:flavin monoamine oxidase family protein [Rhodoferax aquaticus]|uniref:Tryptophan 2-monooxygenase n=1 Tax=Rhodoferax aquaticus TaxID=2527691 RepID=A0A515EJC8_9BURK|nr:NAD(P)/FAD-dependent oxidoreductase [Rhodoferax aquaticus]QDL52765.1 FAD-dependent oxidoreductase [Rhodoferax aquaticus]
MDQLSAQWFDSGSSYDGDELLFLDGYQVLVKHLAAGVNVKLEHEVTAIVDQGSAGVSVETKQGVFTAARVVVTLPLGVLKSGSVHFQPALPFGKQAAIDGLGVGVLNKCCLLFPQTFWDSEFDWLNYLPKLGQGGQWAEWVSFARPTKRPVLMGFNAADFGTAIEQWDDTAIVQSAVGALQSMFGRDIPAPVDALVTRWASDPYARGAYSCHVLGSTPTQRDDLAKNIHGRLFFAGEATERQHYQTVHGAYQSGLRAAQEVLLAGVATTNSKRTRS